MNQLFAIQEVTNMYQSYPEVTYAEKQLIVMTKKEEKKSIIEICPIQNENN